MITLFQNITLGLILSISVLIPLDDALSADNINPNSEMEISRSSKDSLPTAAPPATVPTESEILDSMAEAIKPSSLDKQNIVIDYGLRPSKPLKLDSGPTNNNSKVNIEIEDNENPQNNLRNLLQQGYQAASVGQYEASVFFYKKALTLEPENINILYTLGTLYHKLKQYSQAKEYYKQVLSQRPGSKKILNNFISVIAEENPDAAMKELKKLEEINPEYTPVLAQIAMIHAKKGNYEEAEKYFRKSILFAPNEVLYKYNLAVMFDKQGKYKAAIKLYQEVLEASHRGIILPQSPKVINERISYLLSK